MVEINLQDICVRCYSLELYRKHARWRTAKDISRDILFHLKALKVPVHVKNQIDTGINDIFVEVKRWDDKHAKIFPEEPRNKHRPSRANHLRIFHEDALVWMPDCLRIDDYKTARRIINDFCLDWPQMRFQLACHYAIENLLRDNRVFDKVRRKVFRQRLGSGHCVYDFWLRILEDSRELSRLFQEDRLFVDQLCVQVIHYACCNGFLQLAKYLWRRLTPNQKEAIGFLCWKKVCFQASSPETINFMCKNLCRLNPRGMMRLTWDNFYFKVSKSLEEDYEKNPRAYIENLRKLQMLLENWCPRLRNGLLAMNDSKAISNAFWHNNIDTFTLLLNYANENNLKNAREIIDKIYDKKRTAEMHRLRQAVLCRQMTE